MLKKSALLVTLLIVCAGTAAAQGIVIPVDQDLPPLALERHHVRIEINKQTAITTVEQIFVNNTERRLEAQYIFPVPRGAAMTRFTMLVNGKETTGELVGKDDWIVLASLAPYTAMWYVSFDDHGIAVLFNGAMFALASGAAQIALLRLYRPLIARRRRHRPLWAIWLVLYVFVGVQLAWVLRPFVGTPGLPTQFFRDDSWSNAYVAIAQMIWKLLGG